MILNSKTEGFSMKVRCIGNFGAIIPEEYRKNFCSEGSYFPVEVGNTYRVYAMGNQVGSPILQYLVADDLGYPRYCPSNLFEILEHDLPRGFGFNEWTIGSFHYRIWGYDQILDYKHHEGLIEQNPSDIEVFTKARNLIDKQIEVASDQ
jgi:hypothetical protein